VRVAGLARAGGASGRRERPVLFDRVFVVCAFVNERACVAVVAAVIVLALGPETRAKRLG